MSVPIQKSLKQSSKVIYFFAAMCFAGIILYCLFFEGFFPSPYSDFLDILIKSIFMIVQSLMILFFLRFYFVISERIFDNEQIFDMFKTQFIHMTSVLSFTLFGVSFILYLLIKLSLQSLTKLHNQVILVTFLLFGLITVFYVIYSHIKKYSPDIKNNILMKKMVSSFILLISFLAILYLVGNFLFIMLWMLVEFIVIVIIAPLTGGLYL